MASEEQKPSQDASIEDVLSSIKQIVEQESGKKTPGVPQSSAAQTAVLELSEMEIVAETTAVDNRPVDNIPVAEPEVVDINAFNQTGESVPVKETKPEPAPAAKPVSGSTAKQLPEGHVHLTAIAGAKGLQVGFPVEVLAEALRPLIKDWVDSNLPDIVERLVKEELAKLADK
jgi:cell pole-organizing protein PopZ